MGDPGPNLFKWRSIGLICVNLRVLDMQNLEDTIQGKGLSEGQQNHHTFIY